MAIKRERTNEFNREKLKKWKGEPFPTDQMYLSLPTNNWQKNEKHTETNIFINFKCRACGFVHRIIGSLYTIDKLGNVNPKFQSNTGLCAYSEWLQLEEYSI